MDDWQLVVGGYRDAKREDIQQEIRDLFEAASAPCFGTSSRPTFAVMFVGLNCCTWMKIYKLGDVFNSL